MELKTTFPYFEGDTILYIHGFASSGSVQTVELLQKAIPQARVIAPDLPIDAGEAFNLLQQIRDTERPALIVGTSMGGMFAEMLRGTDRILVNPAFDIAEDLRTKIKIGQVTFHSPRRDGLQSFMLTKPIIESYRHVAEQCFNDLDEADNRHVWGLFGRQDTTVNTHDLFAAHYTRAIRFEGGHQLNDHVFLHSLMPVVQWIGRKQMGEQASILYIHLDALRKEDLSPTSDARRAYEMLAQRYETYLVAPLRSDCLDWIAEKIGVPAYDRVIRTDHPALLYGDYFVGREAYDGRNNFLGTLIAFGSNQFKNWEQIVAYFDLLGGQ